MKIKSFIFTLLSLIILFSSTVIAEDSITTDADEGNNQARYVMDPETGQLMMKIRMWGEVRQPGVILVPSESDLIEIISYAGGPTSMSRLSKVQVIRNAHSGKGEKIITVNIQEFLETGNPDLIPKIYPEDTIIIKSSLWRMVTSSTVFISIALQITQILYNLTRVG